MPENIKLQDLFFGQSDGAIEAKQDNFQKLFFDQNNKYKELNSSNEKFLVIGSKGSGKTYLANYTMANATPKEHIELINAADFIICKLTAVSKEQLDNETIFAFCKWFLLDKLAHLITKTHNIKSRFIPFSNIYKLTKFITKYESEDFYKIQKESITSTTENGKSINGNLKATNRAINSKITVKNSNEFLIEKERKNFFELIPDFEKKYLIQ